MKINKIFKKIIIQNKFYVILNIIFSILASVILSYTSYALNYLGIAVESKNLSVLKYNILLVTAISFTALIIITISDIANSKSIEKLKISLREEITKKLINTDYIEFNNNDSGKYLSWYTNDMLDISASLFRPFFDIFINLSAMISSFIAMYYLNYLIGLSAFVLFIFTAILPSLYMKYMRKLSKRKTVELEKYTENIKNLIMGFNIFFVNNTLNIFLEKSKNRAKSHEKEMFKINCINTIFKTINIFTSLLSELILSAITIFTIIKYDVSLGAIVAVLALSGQFFNSTSSLINNFSTFFANNVLLEKYEYEKELVFQKENAKLNKIIADNISFSYKDKNIFNNFNLNIEYPKKYFVIGESGSGKTTLIKLLLNLYKTTEGKIKYIDTNGKEHDNLANNIAYISQDTYLFNATLKENICLFKNYTKEEIDTVLEKVRLKSFAYSLKDGLDTEISENGKNISGGQKQRIALARAIIQNKRFIIIDEGTSQLDRENAKQIEKIILEDKNICSIIITHHLDENVDGEIIKI